MCLRLRPPRPNRRLRVLSHVLETCVETAQQPTVTSQNVHKELSRGLQVAHHLHRARASVCPVPAAHVAHRRNARRHVPGRGSCNCGAPESALDEDVQILSRRQAQKVILRLDVRLRRPRRKLRFLHTASKDLKWGNRPVQSVTTQRKPHKFLPRQSSSTKASAENSPTRVRVVHEQSVQRLGQNPASQEIRDQKPGVRVSQRALVNTHVIHIVTVNAGANRVANMSPTAFSIRTPWFQQAQIVRKFQDIYLQDIVSVAPCHSTL